MTARAEWIEIQKRLVDELKDSLYDKAHRKDSVLDTYYEEYQREFKDGFERVASRDEIVQRLMRTDIAYFGDFHSLVSAQTAMISLLRSAAQRGRKLILCVEMVHSKDQGHTQDYLDKETDDEQFLWRVKWDEKWGFSWKSWQRFFALANEYNAPLFGINYDARGPNALHDRDDHAAELIAALTRLYPRHLVAVVYGDLHMAEGHLPAAVQGLLYDTKVKRRAVRIYQNSETLYWKLVDKHLDSVVDYLKIRNDVYAIMNATPLVKFQSFAEWQHHRTANLNYEPDEIDLYHEQNLLDQVHQYIKTISDFLGIELEDTANFTIYTSSDHDLLANLVRRNVYTSAEMNALKDYAEMAESAYFERARVLYLGHVSVSNAAEAAGRYILSQVRPASDQPIDSRDEFYARCMVEAVAFFCSKVIDPRRAPRTGAGWQGVLDRFGTRRKLARPDRLDVQTAKSFLRHREYEQKVLETGRRNGAPRSLYTLPTDQHVALTRAIGRVLGQRLYDGVSHGDISRSQVREVMQDPIRVPGLSQRRYFELLELLKNTKEATTKAQEDE
jgi:hypothetical protein